MAESLGPADVKTQPASEATTSSPCAICRRQFSRYTCPRCNIPYCSLRCFRSDSHAECSESFYRKEIESDVGGDASKSAEQRRNTLELLKQFEEDSMNDDVLGLDTDDFDEDHTDLESRMKGLELESASYDDLWSALTPAERETFAKAVRDPNSELAKQLLSSEELEKTRIEPWWEASEDTSGAQQRAMSRSSQKKYGKRPAMMQMPAHMARVPPAPGKLLLLLYNLCALVLSYAYVTRHLAASPLVSLDESERDEARRIISQLVPFLTDRLSRVVHPTLSAAVTDLLSRFQQGAMTMPFLSILLKDAAVLLSPSSVVEVPANMTSSPIAQDTAASQESSAPSVATDLISHPSARAFHVLSDLSALFSSSAKAKSGHITHKLTFYAAYLAGVPPVLVRTLAAEVAERAESIAREGEGRVAGEQGKTGFVGADSGVIPETMGKGRRALVTQDERATKIMELS